MVYASEAFDDGKFAGIRDDSMFFSPLASNSAVMISAKHVFYILCAIGIGLLVGFDRMHDIFLIFVPFFIFMAFYTHKGVQMEYVIYYMMLFLLSWKKEKNYSKKIQRKKTAPLFSSISFGGMEKAINKTVHHAKNIRTIKVNNPDDPLDIELNVGTANRLRYVDVYIGKKTVTTHVPVESDGTLVVAFVPGESIGTILVKVVQSGTSIIIASENITLEVIK